MLVATNIISSTFIAPFKLSGCNVFIRKNCCIKIDHTLLMKSNELNNEHLDSSNGTSNHYNPPKHSDSFLEHLNEVKKSWLNDADDLNDVVNSTDDGPEGSFNYGVVCTGEPAVDPSRQIQSILDGEPDWI